MSNLLKAPLPGMAVALAALAPLFGAAQIAPAAAAEGTCNPNRIAFRTSEITSTTESEDFADIPETRVDIDVGSPSCVIVVFSAETLAIEPHWLEVRARIPGIGNAQIADPSKAVFGRDPDNLRNVHSMQFVFPEVPAGDHKVRLQFLSSETDELAIVYRRTTTVHFEQ